MLLVKARPLQGLQLVGHAGHARKHTSARTRQWGSGVEWSLLSCPGQQHHASLPPSAARMLHARTSDVLYLVAACVCCACPAELQHIPSIQRIWAKAAEESKAAGLGGTGRPALPSTKVVLYTQRLQLGERLLLACQAAWGHLPWLQASGMSCHVMPCHARRAPPTRASSLRCAVLLRDDPCPSLPCPHTTPHHTCSPIQFLTVRA